MRYSFKKTLPSARKHPEPVDDKKDRSREVVPRDLPKEVSGSSLWRESRGETSLISAGGG